MFSVLNGKSSWVNGCLQSHLPPLWSLYVEVSFSWSQPDLKVFLSTLVFNPRKKEWTCHLVVSLAELAGRDSVWKKKHRIKIQPGVRSLFWSCSGNLAQVAFYAKKTLYFIVSFTFYPNYDWQLPHNSELKQLNWRMEKWQREKTTTMNRWTCTPWCHKEKELSPNLSPAKDKMWTKFKFLIPCLAL